MEVSGSTGLRLIAVLKLVKGLLLLAVGVGALKLLHKDVGEVALRWVNVLRVDPDNRFIQKLLMKLWFVDDHTLERVSAGTSIYAGLLLTEGTGLWLAKQWAKYLTIILTAPLLSLEAYEPIKHFSWTKVLVIAVNVAVVWYLVVRLRWAKRIYATGKRYLLSDDPLEHDRGKHILSQAEAYVRRLTAETG